MNESHYQTRDLNLSAFLLVQHGIAFKGLQTFDHKTKEFLFTPRSKCEKLAAEFISGEAEMSVRRFCDGLRLAKDLLFKTERAEITLRPQQGSFR